jgi:LytS/YehU family sensor histidine kinase
LRARTEELKRLVEQRTAELTASLHDLEQQKLHTEERSREVERLNAVLNVHNAELAAQTRVAQLEMLRYQLNPHFLFNVLISIADLVQEDAKHAVRTLWSLMAYLRYALQPTGLPTVPLSEEIKAVESYLAIEKVRFEDRLIVTVESTPEADEIYVPGFMLQPLVENAIKYGMRTSPMPLEIGIRAAILEGALHLEVSNSGSLAVPEHITKPEGTGTGLRNIRERLRVLFPERHEFLLLEESGKVYVRISFYNAL